MGRRGERNDNKKEETWRTGRRNKQNKKRETQIQNTKYKIQVKFTFNPSY